MEPMLISMRLAHILLGVFWAGTLIFNALFLIPAIRDAGPDGAKVGANLMRLRFLEIMPASATITVLSGLWLYWYASAGFQPAYMSSGPGMSYGIGGVTAILALGLGVGIMRPAMLRAADIARRAAALDPAERDAQMATAQRLRLRAAATGRIVAALLVITVAAMAVGRYV